MEFLTARSVRFHSLLQWLHGWNLHMSGPWSSGQVEQAVWASSSSEAEVQETWSSWEFLGIHRSWGRSVRKNIFQRIWNRLYKNERNFSTEATRRQKVQTPKKHLTSGVPVYSTPHLTPKKFQACKKLSLTSENPLKTSLSRYCEHLPST